MLRTGRGRSRLLWRLVYSAAIRAVATILRMASADAVYLRGSFANDKPVYGLSDVDLIAVVGTGRGRRTGRPRLRQRIQRLYARMPAARGVVDVTVMTGSELQEVCLSPFAAYPLEPETGRAVSRARFYNRRSLREDHGPRPDGGLRLYGPHRRWRCVAGCDPVAGLPASPAVYRWLWGWMELQFIWKHAFRTCADPTNQRSAYFCTKMIAEPARLWLWLSSDRRPAEGNSEVLEQALRAMPEEEPALRFALSLRRSLPCKAEAPLEASVAYLRRITARVADLIADQAARTGTTSVTLHGGPRERSATLPLADWRARVLPSTHDEKFLPLSGDPADPELLGTLARTARGSPYPGLRAEKLLVFPTARSGVRPLGDAAFRAIQCPVSDPVSFALMDGSRTAKFANLPGWNAHECATRAVLEHRAWLDAEMEPGDTGGRRLGILFNAARAAIFERSLEAGEPRLPLTIEATIAGIGELDGGAAPVAEAAHDHYLGSRDGGRRPPEPLLTRFEHLVRSLLPPGPVPGRAPTVVGTSSGGEGSPASGQARAGRPL